MKGLNKAFRAVLALSLVLCMVMSCVTVSAATPVTLSETPVVTSKGANGLYEVKYTVSGFAAAEGDATILVWKGASPDSTTVTYLGQEPVGALAESGYGYEFTMELLGGEYTVQGGGTGMGAVKTTLVLDTAPAFADVTALAFNIKTDATEVGAIRTAEDYDNDTITYAVESDVFEVVNGKIVVKADATLEAGTYNLTLTAAANGEAATNSVPVTIVVEEATKYATAVALAETSKAIAWGDAKPALPANAIATVEDATAEWPVEWAAESTPAFNNQVAGAYVYTGTVVAPEGFAFGENVEDTVTYTVNVAERVIDSIVVPDINNIAWGATPELPKNATLNFADGGTEEVEIEWTNVNFVVNEQGTFSYTATVDTGAYTYVGEKVFTKTFEVGAKPKTEITAIAPAEAVVNVAWGETPKFPAVNVTAAGLTEAVEVEWASVGEFNKEVAGEYKFTATVAYDENDYILGVGVNTTVEVTVIVAKRVITAIEAPEAITVPYGAEIEKAPTTTVTFAGGATAEFDLKWSEPNFSTTAPGAYTLTATVKGLEDYDVKVASEFEVAVTVAKRVVEAIKAPEAIVVAYGAEIEKAPTTTVTFAGGETAEFELEWSEPDFSTTEPGTYALTATVKGLEDYDVKVASEFEVAVTVEEDPTIYITAIDTFEDVELAWGDKYEIPATVGAEFSKDTELEALTIVWDNDKDFNNEKAGVYELTGTVEVPEGYALTVENIVELTITVGQKTFVIEKGSAELKEGDKYYIEGEVLGDAVVAAGDAELTISGGEYCSGQTPVNPKKWNNTTVWALGDAKVYITGGTFTAYGLPAGVDASEGQVDMIYAKENAEIYISGGRFEAIGDRKDTVWLLNIHDGSPNAKIVVTGGTFVGWNPATAVNAAEITIPAEYKVVEAEPNVYQVVGKSSITSIPTQKIYVLETDSYDNYVAKLKTTIEGVTVGGQDETITIENITWPESEEEIVGGSQFPADPGESIIVKAYDDFTYPADVLNTSGLVPTVEFITVPETFAYVVNGIEGNKASVVTLKGDDVVIDVDYSSAYANLSDLDATVAYQYALTAKWADTPEWKDFDGKSLTIAAADLDAIDAGSVKLWIKADVAAAHCFEEALISKVTVYREADLFSGQMYFNASVAEDANEEAKYFSAFRVNKARDLEVVFDVKGSNGAYDFANGTFAITATSVADGTTVEGIYETISGDKLNNGRGVIVVPAAKLADLKGAYSFKLSYIEDEAELFTVRRTTHVENIGLWFNSLSINKNATAVGITINKRVPFSYVINYDNTNAEGKVYAGYEIKLYDGEVAADATGALANNEVVGNTWETEIDAKDCARGTYKLYSYANLTNSQNFYDMAYGRTVYLFDGYSNLCNIYLEGSTYSAPVVDDGDLEIAPHWGGRAPEGEGVVFECKLTLVDKNGNVIILEQDDIVNGTVDKDGVITFAADATLTIKGARAALNSSKVTATLQLFAGADEESMSLDATKVKDFWTAYIATK